MEKVKFKAIAVAAAIDGQGNVAAHKCFEFLVDIPKFLNTCSDKDLT